MPPNRRSEYFFPLAFDDRELLPRIFHASKSHSDYAVSGKARRDSSDPRFARFVGSLESRREERRMPPSDRMDGATFLLLSRVRARADFHLSPVIPVHRRSYGGQIFRPADDDDDVDDDGPLDEFKVNLGHEAIPGAREGRRPRATCHREPPGSAGFTLISPLR